MSHKGGVGGGSTKNVTKGEKGLKSVTYYLNTPLCLSVCLFLFCYITKDKRFAIIPVHATICLIRFIQPMTSSECSSSDSVKTWGQVSLTSFSSIVPIGKDKTIRLGEVWYG